MASNKKLTLLRKLKQRKHRVKEGLFVVEGLRAVEQIIENGFVHVRQVFIQEGREENIQCADLSVIGKEDAKDIFDTDTPQGVLAICEIPEETSIEFLSDRSGVIIAFDRIQDPGNAGTMIRTASWFGAQGILIGEGTVDIYNPKVARSSMGALGGLPYFSGDLNHSLVSLEEKGWKIWLLDGNEGATPLTDIQKSEKVVLVVGNEANGIDQGLITPDRFRAMIPQNGLNDTVESLNAAIALSIGLYHLSL